MTKFRDKLSSFLLSISKKIAEHVFNDVNRVIDVVKWICIASIMLTGLTLLNMSKDMRAREATYSNVKEGLYHISGEVRHSWVQEGYRDAEHHSRVLRARLITRIADTYKNDKDKLRHDLTTYVSTNDMQNPLFKIFSDEAFTYERAWMSNTENYRIIITDRQNVLFSTYAREPLRNLKDTVPDIIFNKPYDKLIIFDEEKYTLQDIYIGELADQIDEFNHVKVLAPSYIYEHEDLLGVRDVYPDGTPAVNYKLAVIIAYEPLSDKSYSILSHMNAVIKASKDEEQWIIIKQGSMWTFFWGSLACIFGFAWHTVNRYKKQ